MTFNQLDALARSKRYRGINANDEMLMTNLLVVRLENSSEKSTPLKDTDAALPIQTAFELFPNKAIVWFHLNGLSKKEWYQNPKIREKRTEKSNGSKNLDHSQRGKDASLINGIASLSKNHLIHQNGSKDKLPNKERVIESSPEANMLSNIFGPTVLGLVIPPMPKKQPGLTDPRLLLGSAGSASVIPRIDPRMAPPRASLINFTNKPNDGKYFQLLRIEYVKLILSMAYSLN